MSGADDRQVFFYLYFCFFCPVSFFQSGLMPAGQVRGRVLPLTAGWLLRSRSFVFVIIFLFPLAGFPVIEYGSGVDVLSVLVFLLFH